MNPDVSRYSPASGAIVTILENTCIVPENSDFIGWLCGATNVKDGETFTLNANTTCTAQYREYPFSVTVSVSSGNIFDFSIGASGTFYVDCGEGGSLYNAIEGNKIGGGYTYCQYTSVGTKTIRFGGVATKYNGYSVIEFYGTSKISSVSGSLSALFPQLGNSIPKFAATFRYASGLKSIPSTLFSGYTNGVSGMFESTFAQSGLTSLPEGLFSSFTTGADGMFLQTFSGCTWLTSIPSNLFANITTGGKEMFLQTFSGCTGLTSLPSDLFSGFTMGAQNMFYRTFYGCTKLTSLPDGLFANITVGADYMFNQTFSGCTKLSGYIPPTMFAGLIAKGSPNYSDFMTNMFQNTGLALTCTPYVGMSQYITGYESYWSGKVSCAPAPETSLCALGEYLPKNSSVCIECPRDQYCVGGTYTFDKKIDQGNIMCPGDLRAPQGMSRATQCGRRMNFTLDDGLYVYMHGEKKTDMAVNIDMDMDGTAEYFGNMTTVRVPMNIDFANKPNHNKWVFELYDDFVNSAGKTIKAGTYYVYDDSMTYDFTKIPVNEQPNGYSKIANGTCVGANNQTVQCSDVYSDLNNNEWKVPYSIGTVYGTSLCSSTAGGYISASATPDESSSGEYCWCKATGFIPTGDTVKLLPSEQTPWVSLGEVSSCSTTCAFRCRPQISDTYKQLLFGQN